MKAVCSIAGCDQEVKARTWCFRHYMRWKRHGTVDSPGRERPGRKEAFIREHASFSGDSCLVFPFKANDELGYAKVHIDGSAIGAHRFMCILAHGLPKFDDAETAHSCGNRICVNPKHLRWATRVENAADRILHGTTVRGEKQHRAKFTEQQVLAIYVDSRSPSVLGREHGCTPEAIGNIKAGRTWSWLTGHKRAA